MKKIGIITSSCSGSGTYGCNYGAALQGYALVKQLRIMGFEAYDINYVSDYEYTPMQYNLVKRSLKRLKLLSNIPLVKSKIDQFKHRKELKLLRSKFIEFINGSDLEYQGGEFFNIEKLRNISGEFYAFITGSDLVWYPKKGHNDEGYFLDFVAEGVKRIAYAPSFGVTRLPDTCVATLGELLRGFDSVSVREKSGSEMIREVVGLEVPVVLDPTMLLEPQEYDDIVVVPEKLPEKYIAVYRFGKLDYEKEKIIEISNKLQLPIVYIPSNNDGVFKTRYDIGPGEFIGIIRNAELVLSDSFHCTVFAIVNHKPFLTFYRSMPNEGKDINARMVDLLKLLKLENRLLRPKEDVKYETLFSVDFAGADGTINQLRKNSLDYLKAALEVSE